MGKDIVVVKGEFDIRKAYEVLGQIKGARYGYEVKLKSIRPKNEKATKEGTA